MEKGSLNLGIGVAILIIIIVGGLWYADKAEAPKRIAYTALAQCLTDNETIFYGAFWCPHCAQQKSSFGQAGKALPYTECSTPDRADQTQICKDEEIVSYPTWKFKSGAVCTGFVNPEIVAHLSNCSLPQDGTEYTVDSLYEKLVIQTYKNALSTSSATKEEIDDQIKEIEETVDRRLVERFGTTLEETTDTAHLLAVVAEVVNGCQRSSI